MWDTFGDFTQLQAVGNPSATLKHIINYVAVPDENRGRLIEKITLMQDRDESYRVSLKCINQDTVKVFLSQCKDRNTLFSEGSLYRNQNYLYSTASKDKTVILNSLMAMIGFDPHIFLITDDICNELGLEQNLFLTIDNLLVIPIPAAINEVIKWQSHVPSLIWGLAQAYREDSLLPAPKYNIDSQTLYDLLTAIIPDNPHYRAAQDAIVELLVRLQDADDPASDLKLKFTHSVNGTQQPITDKLFEQMCGYAMGQSPISNIKPDIVTLLQLADEIKRLNDALRVQSVSHPSANPHLLFSAPASQPSNDGSEKKLKRSFN